MNRSHLQKWSETRVSSLEAILKFSWLEAFNFMDCEVRAPRKISEIVNSNDKIDLKPLNSCYKVSLEDSSQRILFLYF